MNLDSLPSLKDIIAEHQLSAKKALGQNFILDQNVTDKIVRAAGDLSGKTVFEIGPGPGGLTRSLVRSNAKKVIALEFDPRAIAALQSLVQASEGKLDVIPGDALRVNLLDLAEGPKAIVANLPYNIATPLLTSWLKQIRETPGSFDSMTLMFQKEVGERITAKPDNKDFGRLGILCQWICDAHVAFDLAPSVFTPPPKVSSSVVHFRPKKLPADAPAFKAVEKLTAAAFNQRRKMIRTTLSDYADKLAALGIEGTLRAENLTVQQFIALASGEAPSK